MSSVSSKREGEPSTVQLLLDLIHRQMEAERQREERIIQEEQQRDERFNRLLERWGSSSAQSTRDGGVAGGAGGVPAQREPLPAAPGQDLPGPTGQQGGDGDPAPRAPLPPGPAGYPSGHGGLIAPGRDALAPADHPSRGGGMADPVPALRAPLPADPSPAGRAGGDGGAAGPGAVLRGPQPPAPGHVRTVPAGYRPVSGGWGDREQGETSAVRQPVTSSPSRTPRYQREERSSSAVASAEKCARCGRAAHRDEQRCPAAERSCFYCQEQ